VVDQFHIMSNVYEGISKPLLDSSGFFSAHEDARVAKASDSDSIARQ